MSTYILIAVLAVVILGFGAVIYFLNQRLNDLKNDTTATLLKQDLLALTDGMSSLKEGLQTHLTDRLDKKPRAHARIYSETIQR